MSKNLKKSWRKVTVISILILLILIIISGVIFYSLFFNSSYNGRGNGKVLENPAKGLSLKEAIEKFDESFVIYLLVNIGAYNLHPPIFGSDTPKIEFRIGDDVYNAEIVNGRIGVGRGEIDVEDIIIWTNKNEAVKMVMDKDYIDDSFISGESSIELVAGKIELASKGYLQIYSQLS